MEAQLLGLTGGESSESEPKPKVVVKKPVKRVKVAAAFGYVYSVRTHGLGDFAN